MIRRNCNTEEGSFECWKTTTDGFAYGVSTAMIDFCQTILQNRPRTNVRIFPPREKSRLHCSYPDIFLRQNSYHSCTTNRTIWTRRWFSPINERRDRTYCCFSLRSSMRNDLRICWWNVSLFSVSMHYQISLRRKLPVHPVRKMKPEEFINGEFHRLFSFRLHYFLVS